VDVPVSDNGIFLFFLIFEFIVDIKKKNHSQFINRMLHCFQKPCNSFKIWLIIAMACGADGHL